MNITIAQLNPVAGNVSTNLTMLKDAWHQAVRDEAVMCIAPELVLQGYPSKDKLLTRECLTNTHHAHAELQALSKQHPAIAYVFGSVISLEDTGSADKIASHHAHVRATRELPLVLNVAVVMRQGNVSIYPKKRLPDDDIFDESRYFINEWLWHISPDKRAEFTTSIGEIVWERPTFKHDNKTIGVTICEDIWHSASRKSWLLDPIDAVKSECPDLVVNVSASPYTLTKQKRRHEAIKAAAIACKCPLVYCNQVGATDDLIFDGESGVWFADNAEPMCLPICESAVETVSIKLDMEQKQGKNSRHVPTASQKIRATTNSFSDAVAIHGEPLIQALCLGIKDYVHKSGFSSVILGLSGGVDSAITAWLAVRALGGQNVCGVMLPSQYSSQGSVDDSLALAKNLNMVCKTISIATMYDACMGTIAEHFDDKTFNFTEENIQARLRGLTLMALSNKHGHLLLTTGNKSELAVGYSTIYGDMCGALNPIGDLLKTQVYALCDYINSQHEKEGWPSIPTEILTKPPSAELRPDQKDEDSLPPYPVLDAIIDAIVVQEIPLAEIKVKGADASLIQWVSKKIKQNEYKRFQSPPILKVSDRAFGQGRRVTII